MSILYVLLLSLLILAVAFPVALWLSSRATRALHDHDEAQDRLDRERIAAAVDPADRTCDAIEQIESLLDQELDLIHQILATRSSGAPVSEEQYIALRTIHRKGLSARRRCGDPALDAEFSWFQSHGAMALTADLSEIDQRAFERDLEQRARELRRSLLLRRSKAVRVPAAVS